MRATARIAGAVAGAVLLAGSALAETPAPLPSSKREVAAALSELRAKYGKDAVKLESQLLAYALQGGSILEASIAIPGIEEHGGHRYLRVELDTGIVYDDDRDPPETQPQRIWTDVILPTLLQFSSLEVPAEGLLLRISYRHGPPEGRVELLRRARDGEPASEVLSLYVRSEHVAGLAKGDLGAAELLERGDPQLNGRPAHIEVPVRALPAGPSPRPLLPEANGQAVR